MNRLFALLFAVVCALPLLAQQSGPNKYWVFLKDKKGTQFDPYSYFDPYAIAHKQRMGLPLADSTDFPVSEAYLNAVSALTDSVVFTSRWLNAVVCYAPENQLAKLRNLPFVAAIETAPRGQAQLAQAPDFDTKLKPDQEHLLANQLASMQGSAFAENNLNGAGIRIAIFDAGFSSVDKNPAFEHIRSRGGILRTYDFVKKREHVYDHSNHGTVVMSCIGGVMEGRPIGLATAADFMLARTEREHSEPFSEEENWLAAMEWAHKHGAVIINSSLGYTHNRYFRTQMDGKTSFVTRAANLAARKGLLVVNAAGNEGAGKWKKIGAPADADSVLSIGGIEPGRQLHTSFSSYGPTADFRMKPNVSAYGHVVGSGKGGFETTQGTSFASPLVAGFAACAWQAKPELKNMQLFKEIEKSGSLYPYFDYAHGYGIPQATYFTGQAPERQPTFEIEPTAFGAQVRILPEFFDDENSPKALPKADIPGRAEDFLYYHIENRRGYLDFYYVVKVSQPDVLKLVRSEVGEGKKIRVHYKGYTASHQF